MRQIDFPAGISPTQVTLELINPTQLVLTSENRQKQVINRGYPLWQGALVLDDVSDAILQGDSHAQENMEIFLGLINGQENYTIIPHGRNEPRVEQFVVVDSNLPDPATDEYQTHNIEFRGREVKGQEFTAGVQPFGLWIDDDTIYIKSHNPEQAQASGNRIYAFDRETRAPKTAFDIPTPQIYRTSRAEQIGSALTGDDTYIYIIDERANLIRRYRKDTKALSTDSISIGTVNPSWAIWTDGTFLWMGIYTDSGNNVLAYNLEPIVGTGTVTVPQFPYGTLMTNLSFNTADINSDINSAVSMWADNDRFYIYRSADEAIYVATYDYSRNADGTPTTISFTEIPEARIDVAAETGIPQRLLNMRDMAQYGGILYAANSRSSQVYAFDITGAELSTINVGDFYYSPSMGRTFRVSYVDAQNSHLSFVPEIPIPDQSTFQRTLGIPAYITDGYSSTVDADFEQQPWNLSFVEQLNVPVSNIEEFNANQRKR